MSRLRCLRQAQEKIKAKSSFPPITIYEEAAVLAINLDHRNSPAPATGTENSPIFNDPFKDDASLPGEIVNNLKSKLVKACRDDVNSDDLCALFLNCQAKILAGIHSCFSLDFDRSMSFKFEEFPNLKRPWIIRERHPYFETVVTLQSFNRALPASPTSKNLASCLFFVSVSLRLGNNGTCRSAGSVAAGDGELTLEPAG